MCGWVRVFVRSTSAGAQGTPCDLVGTVMRFGCGNRSGRVPSFLVAGKRSVHKTQLHKTQSTFWNEQSVFERQCYPGLDSLRLPFLRADSRCLCAVCARSVRGPCAVCERLVRSWCAIGAPLVRHCICRVTSASRLFQQVSQFSITSCWFPIFLVELKHF